MAVDIGMLGKRLRASRDKNGLSQDDLARLSGVGQNQISNLEAGKKPRVSVIVLAKLCEALQVSADYLLGLKGEESEIEPAALALG